MGHQGPVQEEPQTRIHRGADKSLARTGTKQARKHVRDVRDVNNVETRAVIRLYFFLQGKEPKEIHAILTETLACFLPGRAKDLSAPLYKYEQVYNSVVFFLQGKEPKEIHGILTETLACFLPGRAKDLSASCIHKRIKHHRYDLQTSALLT